MSKLKRSVIRSVSFFTLAMFTLTNLSADFVYASPVDPAVSAAGSTLSLPVDLTTFSLPKVIGSVEASFKGSSNQTVIVIQDAHSIPEAQKSIYRLIKYFQKKYGIRRIGLEGASAKLDAQIFKSFPDKKLLKKTFKEYLDRGELAGGTAALIFSETEADYRGLEDWALYEEALEFYRAAMNQRSVLQPKLDLWQKDLNARKEKAYSAKLLAIDHAWLSFQQNETDLRVLLDKLAAVQRPRDGTELAVFLTEIEEQDKDHTEIEQEVKQLAEKMKGLFLDRGLAASFNQKYQDFQIGRMSPQAFAFFLKKAAVRVRLKIKISSALLGGIENQCKMQQMEGTQFFKELAVYVQEVKSGLMFSEEQKRLDQETENFEILHKLLKLELSRDEWDDLKAGPVERLADRERLKDFWADFKIHRNFYKNAEKRDAVFFKNFLGLPDGVKSQPSTAILVAGGFHAQGLEERLKAAEISYLVVIPKIKALPKEPLYREHMQGRVSWKDYFRVEKGRINIYDAFVRGTRDKLLASSGQRPADRNDSMLTARRASLKEWRDQIIRDLSEKNRITEAWNYTRYLDEVLPDREKSAVDKKIAEGMTRVEKFLEGLRGLEDRNQLTEKSILQLMSRATVPVEFTGVAAAGQPNATIAGSFLTVIPRTSASLPLLEAAGEALEALGNSASVAAVGPARSEVRTEGIEASEILNADSFMRHILKPLAGYSDRDELPDTIVTQEGTDSEGPFLDVQGRWRYRIRFRGERVVTPTIPSDTEVNEISLPAELLDSNKLTRFQNAWRRMIIGDDSLNKRFKKGPIENTPYQDEAIAAAERDLETHQKAFVVMATGAGKTRAALEVMRHYDTWAREQHAGHAASRGKGVTIFLVNNIDILNQTEKKLRDYYGDDYENKVGRIYDGKATWNENTEIVFATPVSLLNKGRLDDLIGQRGVDLVIADETHHIPSATNREIYNRLMEPDPNRPMPTAYLGLTATETGRLDRQSIVDFYGRISYEYRTVQGQNEGYLTQINYPMGDGDILMKMGLSEDSQLMIPRDSPLRDEFDLWRYHPSRYPHVLAEYHAHRATGEGQGRGLVLSPSIQKAESLAEFFNNPVNASGESLGESVATVTLTSKDRATDNGRWFEDALAAWKTGEWPVTEEERQAGKPSPYADRPVPKVVIAVDIFNEGVDVPAIDIVMLWSDTESTIKYVQSMGRGLRPSPGKTVLTVVDLVGLLRKPELLTYMGEIYNSRGTRKKKGKQDDGDAPVAADLVEVDGDWQPGLHVSLDMAQVVTHFHNNVPLRLHTTWGSYPNVPGELRAQLDTYIAAAVPEIFLDRGGDGSDSSVIERAVEMFKEFCAEIAESMTREEPISTADVESTREVLMPVFLLSEIGIVSDDDVAYLMERAGYASGSFPTSGVGQMIFSRIQSLVLKSSPDMSESQKNRLYEFFPEFRPDRLNKRLAINRMKNLLFFRNNVLQLSEIDTLLWILNQLELSPTDEWAKAELDQLQFFMIIHDVERAAGDAEKIVESEKAATDPLKWAEGNTGDAVIAGQRGSSWATDRQTQKRQEFYMRAYKQWVVKSEAPLADQFQEAFFDLDPIKFQAQMRRLHLLPPVEGSDLFFSQAIKLANDYGKYFDQSDNAQRAAVAAHWLRLLGMAKIDAGALSEFQRGLFFKWKELLEKVIKEKTELLDNTPEIELREALETLMDKIGLQRRFSMPGGLLGNAEIVVAKNSLKKAAVGSSFSIGVVSDRTSPKRFLGQTAKPDIIKLEIDDRLRHHAILDAEGAVLSHFYGSLQDADSRAEWLALVAKVFQFLNNESISEESLVIALPAPAVTSPAESGSFREDLLKWLLNHTQVDVLYPASAPYNYNTIEHRSRLSFLTADELFEYYWISRNVSAPRWLTQVYANLYQYDQIVPAVIRLHHEVEALELPEDDVLVIARLELLAFLEGITQESQGDLAALTKARRILSLLQTDEAFSLTPRQALSMTGILMGGAEYQNVPDWRLRKELFGYVKLSLQSMLGMQNVLSLRGLSLPEGIRDQLGRISEFTWSFYQLGVESDGQRISRNVATALQAFSRSWSRLASDIERKKHLTSDIRRLLEETKAFQDLDEVMRALDEAMQQEPLEDELTDDESSDVELSTPVVVVQGVVEVWDGKYNGRALNRADDGGLEFIHGLPNAAGVVVLHTNHQCSLASHISSRNLDFASNRDFSGAGDHTEFCAQCVPPQNEWPDYEAKLAERARSEVRSPSSVHSTLAQGGTYAEQEVLTFEQLQARAADAIARAGSFIRSEGDFLIDAQHAEEIQETVERVFALMDLGRQPFRIDEAAKRTVQNLLSTSSISPEARLEIPAQQRLDMAAIYFVLMEPLFPPFLLPLQNISWDDLHHFFELMHRASPDIRNGAKTDLRSIVEAAQRLNPGFDFLTGLSLTEIQEADEKVYWKLYDAFMWHLLLPSGYMMQKYQVGENTASVNFIPMPFSLDFTRPILYLNRTFVWLVDLWSDPIQGKTARRNGVSVGPLAFMDKGVIYEAELKHYEEMKTFIQARQKTAAAFPTHVRRYYQLMIEAWQKAGYMESFETFYSDFQLLHTESEEVEHSKDFVYAELLRPRGHDYGDRDTAAAILDGATSLGKRGLDDLNNLEISWMNRRHIAADFVEASGQLRGAVALLKEALEMTIDNERNAAVSWANFSTVLEYWLRQLPENQMYHAPSRIIMALLSQVLSLGPNFSEEDLYRSIFESTGRESVPLGPRVRKTIELLEKAYDLAFLNDSKRIAVLEELGVSEIADFRAVKGLGEKLFDTIMDKKTGLKPVDFGKNSQNKNLAELTNQIVGGLYALRQNPSPDLEAAVLKVLQQNGVNTNRLEEHKPDFVGSLVTLLRSESRLSEKRIEPIDSPLSETAVRSELRRAVDAVASGVMPDNPRQTAAVVKASFQEMGNEAFAKLFEKAAMEILVEQNLTDRTALKLMMMNLADAIRYLKGDLTMLVNIKPGSTESELKDSMAALINSEEALGRVIFTGETKLLEGFGRELRGHFEYTTAKDAGSVTANGLTAQTVLPGANVDAAPTRTQQFLLPVLIRNSDDSVFKDDPAAKAGAAFLQVALALIAASVLRSPAELKTRSGQRKLMQALRLKRSQEIAFQKMVGFDNGLSINGGMVASFIASYLLEQKIQISA